MNFFTCNKYNFIVGGLKSSNMRPYMKFCDLLLSTHINTKECSASKLMKFYFIFMFINKV